MKKGPIGQIFLAMGFLTPEALEKGLARAKKSGKRIGEALIEEGSLNEEQVARSLAAQFSIPYLLLEDFRVDPAFFKMIPVELMHRYPFVPHKEKDGLLDVVVSDPTNIAAADELELILKKEVRFSVATRTALLKALEKSEGSAQVLKEIEAEFRPLLITEDERGEEVLSIDKIARDASPVVRLVDTLILNALVKRASDIHLEATGSSVIAKYRIDGVLYRAMELDAKLHGPLVSRVKILAELDIAEKRVPQDGRFKMRLDNKKVDFRVSILPSIFGEDVVIRVLDKEYITADLDELRLDRLGFNPGDLRRFRRAISEPYGMVLVTGPTGSGKTTTLYAAISEINTSEDKIVTIEDPVEYQLRDVVQIPVNEKKGLTFARGLRSILRHDPDKIMVGEIRDPETAQIAIQSALTGHLVFTTVHANNAFDVIGRFVNMGIEPYNFVSSLNCILAQRLVRKVCQVCRVHLRYPAEILSASGLDTKRYADFDFVSGKGCDQCGGTGYRGRTAISEFLALSDPIREMILARRPASEIRKAALAEGMTTIRQAGLEKVEKGETTLREINRVTFIE